MLYITRCSGERKINYYVTSMRSPALNGHIEPGSHSGAPPLEFRLLDTLSHIGILHDAGEVYNTRAFLRDDGFFKCGELAIIILGR
jgi:hypothetical protein